MTGRSTSSNVCYKFCIPCTGCVAFSCLSHHIRELILAKCTFLKANNYGPVALSDPKTSFRGKELAEKGSGKRPTGFQFRKRRNKRGRQDKHPEREPFCFLKKKLNTFYSHGICDHGYFRNGCGISIGKGIFCIGFHLVDAIQMCMAVNETGKQKPSFKLMDLCVITNKFWV